MDIPNPRTFEFAVDVAGSAVPGHGLVAAYVPAAEGRAAVVALANDPRRDSGHPIQELAVAAIGWLRAQLGPAAADVLWVAIDNLGRFYRALPKIAGDTVTEVVLARFVEGVSIEAFYSEAGAHGEVAIELLTMLIEEPNRSPLTPPMEEFLDALEAHESLPAPGLIFRKVSLAADAGDARAVAQAIQPDPVIAATLIHYANAARFAAGGRTASVPQAVARLGTAFVKRVVFVAEMMARYRKGVCPAFDYRAFWTNAVATGAAMRALLPEYDLPATRADEAFTTGLVAGIGWLVVAETYPALMIRYLDRIAAADPVTKARAQREIFPCEMRKVSERYLLHFDFPESVLAAVAGRGDVDRLWHDALARATRIGQALSPFACLAIPTTLPVPDACRAEWAQWQAFVSAA